MLKDIGRWKTELQLAEKFRNEDFGEYTDQKRFKAGENIDYFEKGYSTGYGERATEGEVLDTTTTLNLFHVVAKLIVPSLYYQNPQITVRPKRKLDEDSAPIAKGIMNYFYKEIGADEENEMVVWDGYVLNRGVYKVGYATKFGMDIPDPSARNKSAKQGLLERIGLVKPKKEEIVRPEINQKIVAEYPYVKWVSPFRFLMDPRARTIEEAQWVAEEFDKTVAELKRNKNYKNTEDLEGSAPDVPRETGISVPDTCLEEFYTVRLYEIHYRHTDKYYRLVVVKDGDMYKELYHEESIYEMDGFQYDVLEFNKHGHLQFKRSDLCKVKNVQDRITSTFDSILDQLDRFVPKIAYDSNAVSSNGINALENGDVGAIIECNKPPREAIQEIALTQFKQDLKALIDDMVNVITIMTGVTQSKLLGLSSARTATGETIAQGGENIRMADMAKSVQQMANRQARKLWQVIRQFVTLEDLQLITGENGIDPVTGRPLYTWLPEIDTAMSEKLAEGEYAFDIEVGSTQKVDSELITKRIENLISILARTDTIAIMQTQGKKVDLAEILRLWLQNNPEIVRDVSRIIQDVNAGTQGLIPAQEILLGGKGGITAGSETNAARAQEASPAPTMQNMAGV